MQQQSDLKTKSYGRTWPIVPKYFLIRASRVTMKPSIRLSISTLVLCLLSGSALAQHGIAYETIQGRFCETRVGGCCPGRADDCHTPILDHLCYCDDFCDDPIKPNHDCCPDFFRLCKGIEDPNPPKNYTEGVGCYHEGQIYRLGDTRKHNCNQCQCETSFDAINPDAGRWMCEQNECLIDPNSIESINRGGSSGTWTASNYSDFWGRTLSEGILYRLGTLEPERAVRNMNPVKHVYDVSQLPPEFDARTKWPSFIQPVTDQGWCGADWAKTTAAITADRLAIQSKGNETAELSAQHLLSCDSRGQQGCTGGHLDRAWNFMRLFGIVDEDCYPYKSGTTGVPGDCKISRRTYSLADVKECQTANRLNGRTDLYKTGPAYRIKSDENDIKYEILSSGPVQAVMSVSGDFFMYRNGIYQKSSLQTAQRVGYHSVRIIGWGESFIEGRNVKYWTVANTWGTGWGEQGFFRILRGENECDIETFIIATWAKTANRKAIRRKELKSLDRYDWISRNRV